MDKEETNNDNWSTIAVTDKGQDLLKVEYEIEPINSKEKEVSSNQSNRAQEEGQRSQAQGTPATVSSSVASTKEEHGNEEAASEHPELVGVETQGAQKRIRQLIRQRKERDEAITRLVTETTSLKASLQERDTQLTATLKNSLASTEGSVEANIQNAKELFKRSIENSDTDGLLNAQEAMAKGYADIAAIREKKNAWLEYEARQKEQQTTVRQQAAAPQEKVYDDKAIKWAGKNDWFGKDQVMTKAALTIDEHLREEGYDSSEEDYYTEVDRRLRDQFPTRNQEQQQQEAEPPVRQQQTRAVQSVAGASRTSPKTSSNGGNKVKLTQDDVRLANKWGIPLEKYAAEKLKVQEADGDYTSINL